MSKPDIISAIVLVVGTGSVAMSYKRKGKEFERVGRVGGWGRLLGDEGSGYAIGREGIRRALKDCDAHALRKSTADGLACFSPLSREVLEYFQRRNADCTPETLLSHILIRSTIGNLGEDDDASRTKTIASAASAVFAAVEKDAEAKEILESGASNVAELVRVLVKEQIINVSQCALVLGGGLMGNIMYRDAVRAIIQEQCGKFNQVKFINEPAVSAAKSLFDHSQDSL
jgi:N-acetylmuramic acid 6-phosphate etherase